MEREPYLDDGDVVLYAGDCVEVMAELPGASVDAVVTDPPYGLGFMGQAWDDATRMASFTEANTRLDKYPRTGKGPSAVAFDGHAFGAWCETWAAEALRVLKPGGHLLAFGGTRTYHRLACAIEDAGFEIRDALVYMYGSGFPKSLDVSKAIDRAAGAEREVVGPGRYANRGRTPDNGVYENPGRPSADETVTAPATPAAAQWQGWGTALKPGHEPIVVARKPLAERTVAAQVLATGTGAINVDGCRIGTEGGTRKATFPKGESVSAYGHGINGACEIEPLNAGRWPANVVLDEQAAALLDAEVGESVSRIGKPRASGAPGNGWGMTATGAEYADRGGPSRYYYTAKAGADEREGSKHPTVKPLALMRWLVRLVTPPGGVVLEPFAGSGTTLRAAREEGFRAIGIEREAEYLADCAKRLRQLSLLA